MGVVTRAREVLSKTSSAPRMYASTKEAFLCHVCGIVCVVDEQFDVSVFYEKHLTRYGSMFTDLTDQVDDNWAREVCEDALSIIGEKDE